tara:strand:- start:438 stop:1112 length:675 start_codon:yes stop_codon:yes gene_type:complete
VSALAFDLDGTLIDTIPDMEIAANNMLKELNLPSVNRREVEACIGAGLDYFIETLIVTCLKGKPVSSDLLSDANFIFRKEYKATIACFSTVYPGVVDTLQMLKKKKIPIACVTNKPKLYAEKTLASFNLKKFFKTVLAGDSLPRKKPDPMPLVHLAELLKIEMQRILMIGDSEVDVKAARKAGAPVFCVSYGYHGDSSLESFKPDVILSSTRDIFNHVRFINNF